MWNKYSDILDFVYWETSQQVKNIIPFNPLFIYYEFVKPKKCFKRAMFFVTTCNIEINAKIFMGILRIGAYLKII